MTTTANILTLGNIRLTLANTANTAQTFGNITLYSQSVNLSSYVSNNATISINNFVSGINVVQNTSNVSVAYTSNAANNMIVYNINGAQIAMPMISNNSPAYYGFDGVVAVSAAGRLVNGHGNPLTLKGFNMTGIDTQITGGVFGSNRYWANNPWGSTGQGSGVGGGSIQTGPTGPSFPAMAYWRPNCIRYGCNPQAFANVSVAMPVWGGNIANSYWSSNYSPQAMDTVGNYKQILLEAIQGVRSINCYSLFAIGITAPQFTLGNVTNWVAATNQPPFLDYDSGYPFWCSNNASTSLPAWLATNFGSQQFNSTNGFNGGAAGQYYNSAIGGPSGLNDFIFELFNEPYLTTQAFTFYKNNADGTMSANLAPAVPAGAGLSGYLTYTTGSHYCQLIGGWCNWFYQQGSSTSIPGVQFTGSVSGNTLTVSSGLVNQTQGANNNSIQPNMVIFPSSGSIATNTIIMPFGTNGTSGTGGTGTYALSNSATISSTTIVATGWVNPSNGSPASSGGNLAGALPLPWRILGYQTCVNAIRAMGFTNVIQINGDQFAQTQLTLPYILPVDTLSPPQFTNGGHPYPQGGVYNSPTNYPANADNNTNSQAVWNEYANKLINGTLSVPAPSWTTGWSNNMVIPVVYDEWGDESGPASAGTLQVSQYDQQIMSYVDANPGAIHGVCFAWQGPSPNNTTGGPFTWTVAEFGPWKTFTGAITTGNTTSPPTLNVTSTPNVAIVPGDVFQTGNESGTYVINQLSGTQGGIGLYSVSVNTAVTSGTLNLALPVAFYGHGNTMYNWMVNHP
jgi:hypothetical protein